MRLLGAPAAVAAACSVAVPRAEVAPPVADDLAITRAAIDLACAVQDPKDLHLIGRSLPGVAPTDPMRQDVMLMGGWRKVYPLEIGHLTIDWLAPRGHLHHIRVRLDRDGQGTPAVYAMVDTRCALKAARRIRYDEAGLPVRIEHLGPALVPTGGTEPINPPVPRGKDPAGIPVALVDTGVDYTVMPIAARLARTAEGGLAGYDYWDMDSRPFDENPTRSPFFPGRHGTEVASILLREAPVARLLAYRYPRPDMSRFAELVSHAAQAGARVLNLSMVSYHESDWAAFGQAIANHPDILFIVAAGNDRRDLDRRPVYPAAFQYPNLITVTAADGEGRLTKDANWGRGSVDIAVPAAGITAIGFAGETRSVTGSSYGAARISALAVCLIAANPTLSATDTREQLLALAMPSEPDRPVRHGFISDGMLTKHHGCRDG